jgi:hypothetical protein
MRALMILLYTLRHRFISASTSVSSGTIVILLIPEPSALALIIYHLGFNFSVFTIAKASLLTAFR